MPFFHPLLFNHIESAQIDRRAVNGLKCLKDYYPKVSSATDTAEDRFFWFYSRHKTVPPAIFYLLVINRFLKPNRISPYLSRRIYPVHVRTNMYTGPPMVDVITVKTKNIFPLPFWTRLKDSNNYEYS